MSSIVDLDPVEAERDTPSYRKIRAGSRGFVVLFTALLALFGVFAATVILGIAFGAPYIYVGPRSMELMLPAETRHPPPEMIAFATLGLWHRLAYALVGLVKIAPVLTIFANLRALFGLYARGVVFAKANAAHLKWIGVGLIAYGVVPGLSHLFLTATKFEIDRVWFHASSPQALVLGGLVIVIAQVMEVGREIEEDRSQYV